MNANGSKTPIANPEDSGTIYRFTFGAYGTTAVYALGHDLESAFEIAVEWLDDNAPGHLTTIGEDDYRRAADELGVEFSHDAGDEGMQRVFEAAEADMTMIGHTTLKNGNAIPSWEWTVDEVYGEEQEEVEARIAELEEA